ncbi:hypothetical protein LTR16_004937 [Cryomyces antarcticus]|uniref:AAA+ ATPase lid domain-containing protein n=1 Tax=Cryomyces antarcticus TaxID=329879 RepID=A0ABR0M5T3_9PEZI|nr:hypothetical protein LTR39_004335 [Cryomyces antarcticus]KAK5012230.1 hypothetical protein LTR60_004492 [Cryomyces antarcticus]KAK5284835.1 hypothetical protein LTR16_004937 [Cryomyces antarcticus]
MLTGLIAFFFEPTERVDRKGTRREEDLNSMCYTVRSRTSRVINDALSLIWGGITSVNELKRYTPSGITCTPCGQARQWTEGGSDLHYENLNKAQRLHIWRNFIGRLEDLEVDFDVSDVNSHINDFAKFKINGRRIRDAIVAARQLALFKRTELTFEHLKHAILVSGKFDKHLDEVHARTPDDKVHARTVDDQFARDGGMR